MLDPMAASSSGSPLGLLFPVILVAALYFLLIRPQRQRQRNAQRVQTAVSPGVEVVTTSGLFGTVTAVDDDAVTLEISPGVSVRFLRQAVGRVLTPPSTDPAAELPPDDRPPV